MELVESKLRPPWTRPGIVPRTALAERLAGLGIDPTPLFAATTGILRLYADTLEHPDPRR